MNRFKNSVGARAPERTPTIATTVAFALSIAACSGRVQTITHDEDANSTSTGGAKNGAGGASAMPPAQGAVTLSISPTPGQTCSHTSPQLSMPSAENTSVFGNLLGCNLSTGCKPDEYLVVDREPGTSISCIVSPSGGNFNVSISMSVDGSASGAPSMQFQANGMLTSMGGTLTINESNSIAMGGGLDPACQVSIPPNMGVIAKGKMWAQFQCTMFRDPSDLADTGCTVTGAFLFENCTG